MASGASSLRHAPLSRSEIRRSLTGSDVPSADPITRRPCEARPNGCDRLSTYRRKIRRLSCEMPRCFADSPRELAKPLLVAQISTRIVVCEHW
jgi:hypothetical protein